MRKILLLSASLLALTCTVAAKLSSDQGGGYIACNTHSSIKTRHDGSATHIARVQRFFVGRRCATLLLLSSQAPASARFSTAHVTGTAPTPRLRSTLPLTIVGTLRGRPVWAGLTNNNLNIAKPMDPAAPRIDQRLQSVITFRPVTF